LLKRHGLVPPRRRRAIAGHPGRPASGADAPNTLWAIDFKGQFRTGDGGWCYPLTLQDSYSRYLLACEGLPHPSGGLTRAVLERVFRRWGIPERIRSDNGEPFASTYALARLSRLRVWFIRLGIHSELIEPAQPQQNGRLERLHRTLKAETARPAALSLRAQRGRFARWRRRYNTDRPHEALQQRRPAQLYTPSPRPYPSRLPCLAYPSTARVLRVGRSGHVPWRGRHLSVSHVLTGEDVAFLEVDDGVWAAYFGPVLLGYFHEQLWRLLPLARIKPGRSAAHAASRLKV
jgi:transposase InsO family protein